MVEKKSYEPPDEPKDDKEEDEYKIAMTIFINREGKVRVHGPVNNRDAAYNLLEAARHAINEYHQEINSKPVIKNGFRNFVRGLK